MIPADHAKSPLDFPAQVPQNERTTSQQMPFTQIRDYGLAYRQGKTTPVQVAEQVIQSIRQSQQTSLAMNAISASYAEEIIKQAETSADLIKKGKPRSFLEGVPVAIKDEIDLVPYPTTVGTSFLGKQPVEKDSYVASRLRAAGAILIGKTNMHEIGIAPMAKTSITDELPTLMIYAEILAVPPMAPVLPSPRGLCQSRLC
jgi:Asp-tRNA(Asn)/Glu-tRNA(Gln) amidotransferase A subunit family amidase